MNDLYNKSSKIALAHLADQAGIADLMETVEEGVGALAYAYRHFHENDKIIKLAEIIMEKFEGQIDIQKMSQVADLFYTLLEEVRPTLTPSQSLMLIISSLIHLTRELENPNWFTEVVNVIQEEYMVLPTS